MSHDQDEEEQLRSVTLQNAQSIFLARQRADEELVRVKEALELRTQELARSVALMRATLESTTDGILATDGAGKVTGFNDKYVTMWRLPREVMDGRDHLRLVELNCRNVKDPAQFIARVEQIYAGSPAESYDLLELRDGRVFERSSRLQLVDGRAVGRVWSFRDVTEHRRAQEALRRQSDWLRVTLSSIGDAVVTTDTEGRVLSLNGVAESLTGWTQREAQGRPLVDVFRIVNEDTGQAVENPAARVLKDGQIVGLANHTVLITRDGAEIPIDDSAAPIRDAEGNVFGVVLIFRSIAERRQAEEARRRSEAELAEFFDHASVGLHWVAPDGTILRANQAELDLLGYSREEYVGHNIAEFHVDQEVISDVLGRLAAGEALRDYEVRMKCKDGSFKHVLIDTSVIREHGRIVHNGCFTRDITDRKRVEEAQARLAAIVESSEDAIVGKTLDSRILSWNAGAERLFGYRAEEVVGKSITLLIPGDRQDEERLILDRVRRGERLEHYDTVRISKDGRQIDVSLTVSPVLDSAGRVIAASSIARDITASKRAEQALRDSEQRFRLMAKMIPSVIWTAAPDGTITYANERWFDYCGLTAEENTRQWAEFVLHPDDHQRCVAMWTRALREGTEYEIEVRNRRRDGVYRWFVTRAVPLRDVFGRIVQWFGTATDIDDRKRAEQSSRFLADASATLVELTDYESTLQRIASLAVPAFADWCALDVLELDGSIRRLAVVHGDPTKSQASYGLFRHSAAQASNAHGVGRVLRTGESEWVPMLSDSVLQGFAEDEEQVQLIRKLGLKSYICTPLRSRVRTLGVLTFATAESGRVFDDTDLAAAEDLAHRAVIAIENASLIATLKESDRRKDEFLAMLAHELRNPLAPIRNAVHIFRGTGAPVPQLQWATEVIDRQLHQMTRLVDDLLDVSRITRGKIELRREFVELATVLNSAIEASRPLIEKWGHELTVTIPPQPIRLDADPTRLAQVLLNLLTNAAKYTDQGGRIWVTAEAHSDHVLIRVKDNGIGIPAEMLPGIFDMFAQVDRSLERSEGGLGIGLTLVQRLVEMHGGSVGVHSDGPGRGSEFVVRLPLAAEGEGNVSHKAAGAEQSAAPATHRILVVDDNRDAADSLGVLLRMMGNEVHTAHDGLEAVGAAAAFKPDVVLLDIGLPKLNGYEAARRIREQEGGADILLVALTGWGQEDDRRRSTEAGFDYHMTKPVEFGLLKTLLAEINPRRSGRRQAERN